MMRLLRLEDRMNIKNNAACIRKYRGNFEGIEWVKVAEQAMIDLDAADAEIAHLTKKAEEAYRRGYDAACSRIREFIDTHGEDEPNGVA